MANQTPRQSTPGLGAVDGREASREAARGSGRVKPGDGLAKTNSAYPDPNIPYIYIYMYISGNLPLSSWSVKGGSIIAW